MRYSKTLFAAFVTALIALLAGCSKAESGSIVPQGECDGTVRFAVDVAGNIEEVKAGTKAGDAQTIRSFKVAAYNNSGNNYAMFIAPGTEVEVSGSGESASTDIIWTKPYDKVFYAYANLPASGASVAQSYEGQTLTFTALPESVEDQTDVLLAAVATDGGPTRTAALSFKHALASVTFEAGQMQNVAKINSITVCKVYKNGTLTQSSTGSSWSGMTATQDIAQDGLSVVPPSSGTVKIGGTLFLIPQTGSVTVKLSVTMTDSSTRTLIGTIDISDDAWKAGYATTYTIKHAEETTRSSTPAVTACGTGDDLTVELEVKD